MKLFILWTLFNRGTTVDGLPCVQPHRSRKLTVCLITWPSSLAGYMRYICSGFLCIARSVAGESTAGMHHSWLRGSPFTSADKTGYAPETSYRCLDIKRWTPSKWMFDTNLSFLKTCILIQWHCSWQWSNLLVFYTYKHFVIQLFWLQHYIK